MSRTQSQMREVETDHAMGRLRQFSHTGERKMQLVTDLSHQKTHLARVHRSSEEAWICTSCTHLVQATTPAHVIPTRPRFSCMQQLEKAVQPVLQDDHKPSFERGRDAKCCSVSHSRHAMTLLPLVQLLRQILRSRSMNQNEHESPAVQDREMARQCHLRWCW